MIAIIALILQVLISLVGNNADVQIVVIPPMPQVSPAISEDQEWAEYRAEAYEEYADEFTALFNSYNYKLSRNGRSMINGKFVKMGA